MTLEQLRIFVAVAERQHVTRAAAALNLTQSATSAAIKALEDRYGMTLFDRVGRGIALTEAGRLFLDEARAVLARAAAAERVLIDLAGLKKGALALAASQTVGNYWLPPLMQSFRRLYPGIALSLAIGNTEQVAAWIHDSKADLGIVEDLVEDQTLLIGPVAEDELVLVVGPDHPWAARPSVAPGELTATGWVLREPGSGTRSIFERWLAGLGQDPSGLEVALELPSNEAVRQAVSAGAGATVISRMAVGAMLASGALFALDLPLPRRQFHALAHKDRNQTRAMAAFRAVMAEIQGKG